MLPDAPQVAEVLGAGPFSVLDLKDRHLPNVDLPGIPLSLF